MTFEGFFSSKPTVRILKSQDTRFAGGAEET